MRLRSLADFFTQIAPVGRNFSYPQRYTQFKKYFSKMNNEDRLSKRGINLIFSKTKEGDNMVFSPLHYENSF
jgi:hypothetical protein